MEHIKELEMYIKKYGDNEIFEFDSLDELRNFDESYWEDTRSAILKDVAERLNLKEQDLTELAPLSGESGEPEGFTFRTPDGEYIYFYKNGRIEYKK